MPSKDKITDEVYGRCKDMLRNLLKNSRQLGVGYVLQLVYELAVVVIAYEAGSSYALDKYYRDRVSGYRDLVTVRNVVNHNSYDVSTVTRAVSAMLTNRTVEELYVMLFGEAAGYGLFETECYLYLEYMKRLWNA